MNYCRATFEIKTRIRHMAPLLYTVNFSKLRFRVKDERTLISAKNCVDLSSISEVRSYITEWLRFLAHPVDAVGWGRVGSRVENPDTVLSLLCIFN